MTPEEPAGSLHGDLAARIHVETSRMPWAPSPSASVWRKRLHRVGPAEAGQVTSLVRYEPRSRFPAHDHPEGEEILVLEGDLSDECGAYAPGSWLRLPVGASFRPRTRAGCTLYVKYGGIPGLRPAIGSRSEAEPPCRP